MFKGLNFVETKLCLATTSVSKYEEMQETLPMMD